MVGFLKIVQILVKTIYITLKRVSDALLKSTSYFKDQYSITDIEPFEILDVKHDNNIDKYSRIY